MKLQGINKNLLNSKIALLGFNRNELASALNISPQSVTNLRNGVYNPTYETMNKLYIVLELTPEEAYQIFFEPNLRSAQVI